jgi:multidrug resistance efflux pump
MHLLTRTRPRGWITFIAFVPILIGFGAPLSYAHQSDDAVRVEAEEARKSKLVNDIPLTRSLTAARIATLSAEVSGLISGLNVDIGDQLKAGDTLLELDDELAEIGLQRARASASSARERLQNSERRLAKAQRLAAKQYCRQRNSFTTIPYPGRQGCTRMSSVPDVAQIEVRGGAQRQVQIRINPKQLSARDLTLSDVRSATAERNVDASAGEIDSGKRRYLLRTDRIESFSYP